MLWMVYIGCMGTILTPSPGISIIAIDPGKTTGIAIWDAWDKRLYVDHIDAGRGRKVRYRVHAGVIESPSRREAELALCDTEADRRRVRAGGGLRKGKQGNNEAISIVERGVTTVLCDLVMALGPRSFVVMEDFILGTTGGTAHGGRDGLSPVRIAHRFDERAWDLGLFSGDAWRNWQGHGWAGADVRGWRIRDGVVPSFARRLSAVEQWRVEGIGDERDPEFQGSVWAGAGCRMEWQMPSARSFLRGGVSPMKEWLREREMWMAGAIHGMDALMHLAVFARKLGAEVQAKPERIWFSGAKVSGKGVTAKSA